MPMNDPTGTVTIPSAADCFRLMELHGMLPNIREHSMVVAAVGQLLAHPLARRGLAIDPDLVMAGALLHDIGKTPSLGDDRDHARLGGEICRNHGLANIATIVEQHIVLREFPERQRLTETEIVYYADKRVKHDRVVDLEDRLRYILERYGDNDPERRRLIRENFAVCRAVEQRIFALLSFTPAEVARLAGREKISREVMPWPR